ncbi:MAG: hypothetical protein RIR00_2460 [Pseudomonadota bacterium]|jgi:rare lipoprotein A
MKGRIGGLLSLLLLAACSSVPYEPEPEPAPVPSETTAAAPAAVKKSSGSKRPTATLKKGGGYYKDDGPGDDIPDNLDDIPDAEPRLEPLHKPAMRPYVVLGKEYVPNTGLRPYKARGIASWYGRKFHGQKTSIGEPYDMFAMTAAHTTLALPSYVRVTNLQNGRAVVVRVTDRGPFHVDRIIDLSYAAAWKLGLVNNGSGLVEVESLMPAGDGGLALPPPVRISRAEQDEIAKLAHRLEQEQATRPLAAAAPAPAAAVPVPMAPVPVAQGTSPTPAAVPPAAATPGNAVYLQLGAFASADNAENLKNHLARDLDWVSEPMLIHIGGAIHRLQLGPYPNRAAAEKVAERIRQTLGYKPTFVVR